jgi:hypothetical protein
VKPIRTPWTNKTFLLSGGGLESDLPVETAFNAGEPDEPVIRSMWALTDQERDWVKSGARIELVIFGEGHPPVAMHVCDEEGNVLGTEGDVEHRTPGDDSLYAAAEQYRRIMLICKLDRRAQDALTVINDALTEAMGR